MTPPNEMSARMPFCALVVMGVSGSGKSTIARLLAQDLGWAFCEGDGLHPPGNIAKMAAGHALTDDDRRPWLQRVAEKIADARRAERSLVVSCSALKRVYRDFLRQGHDDVRIVYLQGSRAVIAQRLATRSGHFMPQSLLDSQFATLEEPAPQERAIIVSIDASPRDIVAAIHAELAMRQTLS